MIWIEQRDMTEHPSRKVMNFRHLLSCDTIGNNNLYVKKAHVPAMDDQNQNDP